VTLTPGTIYSRHEIYDILGGGELETYLPQKNNRILCACLNPLLQPGAPSDILVGAAPRVEEKAAMLCQQGGAIPVFLKRAPNRWEYVGKFRVGRWTKEANAIRIKAREAGRTGIVMLISLTKA
jgi:hypothetical protein